MAYGTLATDVVQSSTTGTPTQFQDGSGTQIGTLCRAWVNFNGNGGASRTGYFNVSSVTRSAAGSYSVSFSNAMPDATYAVTVGIAQNTASQYDVGNITSLSTSGFTIYTANFSATLVDNALVCCAIFR
jgi:hypothetical protein